MQATVPRLAIGNSCSGPLAAPRASVPRKRQRLLLLLLLPPLLPRPLLLVAPVLSLVRCCASCAVYDAQAVRHKPVHQNRNA